MSQSSLPTPASPDPSRRGEEDELLINDLTDLGPLAVSHKKEIDEVRKRLGITHTHLDGWIFNFLENKFFNVEETVAKFQRRALFEEEELAKIVVTESMRENMRGGVIQLIGEDKCGRKTFYINTRRDFPTAKMREERTKIFDMWLTLGTQLRKDNRRCRITMLINQKDAGIWKNTDMNFQSSVALRIAKYYPGVVDKMYIVNMGNTLSKFAKPIFSRLPAGVSERIFILTDNDVKKGKLHELFDESILPVELGGKYDCDKQEKYDHFAATVENHWMEVREAIRSGISVKDWEVEQAFGAGLGNTIVPSPGELDLVHNGDAERCKTPDGLATDDLVTCEENEEESEQSNSSGTMSTCNSIDDDDLLIDSTKL